MSKDGNPGHDDPDMQILRMLVDQRNIANATGNQNHVNSLDGLINGAFHGGAEGALQAYVDGPDYNRPRAVEARSYIQKMVKAHQKACETFTALFREVSSGNHRPLRKLRKEFTRVCDELRQCNLEYLYTAPNGSTIRGPKIAVEGEICMDPFLKADANKLSDFWAQSPVQIESGARALAGVGQNAGPRLTQAVDPTLN